MEKILTTVILGFAFLAGSAFALAGSSSEQLLKSPMPIIKPLPIPNQYTAPIGQCLDGGGCPFPTA